MRQVLNVFDTRSATALWNDGTNRKASSAITISGPTRLGRQPASRVRTPKTLLKNRRYQGSRTASASSSELPQRRQKWRTGSLPSPHWPQIRSPGWRRVGASRTRGAVRGRATVGATEIGRREIGSSAGGTRAGGGALATGAPTPARTGSGAEVGAAATGDS